ncbi:5-hydroxyisourate hydrolase-like isoform X2 [Balaenoptera musculus]|uniref:Transthyretin n=1 Tax=Balaenoptera musculus TaxID=9771 RepID=A0A8B8VZT0_BALMU|nr:5-hydroxyisourate hydrolase-like isoform X2 [Balaenoptera musculus]
MAVCHRSLRGSSTRSSSPRAQGQFGTLSPGAVYTSSAAPYRRAQTQGSTPAPLVAQGRGMEPGSSPLSTHVLDTASGLPAQGLCLRLSRLEDHGQHWTELRKSYTDPDGRCPGLLLPGQMKVGTYKLSFDTEGYWQKRGQESFYPSFSPSRMRPTSSTCRCC